MLTYCLNIVNAALILKDKSHDLAHRDIWALKLSRLAYILLNLNTIRVEKC